MRYEEACHWIKLNYITQASNLDQVKEKESHGNNLVQELVINVEINKRYQPCKTWLDSHSLSRGVIPTRGISFK